MRHIKNLHLCAFCRELLADGYAVTELKSTNSQASDTQICDNCGEKTIVTFCSIARKGGPHGL